jgi:hypothetical protein
MPTRRGEGERAGGRLTLTSWALVTVLLLVLLLVLL